MTKLHPSEVAARLQHWDREIELPAGRVTKEIDEQRRFKSNRQRNRGKRTPFGFIREDRVHQQIPNMEEGED